MQPVESTSTFVPERRIANKAELSEFFGLALSTVDKWLRRGMPAMQHGSRGRSWQFDLLEVAKWKYGAIEEQTEDPEDLAPKERLDWYRGTRERTKHLQEAGELIDAAVFERELGDVLKLISVTLESLPDVLERDAGIDGEAVERVQAVGDRIREELHRKLIDMRGVDDGA